MTDNPTENYDDLTAPVNADLHFMTRDSDNKSFKMLHRANQIVTLTKDIYIDASRFISVTTNGAAINELE